MPRCAASSDATRARTTRSSWRSLPRRRALGRRHAQIWRGSIESAGKKGSNDEWKHPHDPDTKITKMKDGRTHLAHKAEHAIDLETGAIVGATVQGADQGDTTTIQQTLPEAAEQLEAVAAVTDHTVEVVEEVVADKVYH